ncbi:MAG TPA: 30S ribosomal protein S13 [Nitrososphaeraceae archaeon]
MSASEYRHILRISGKDIDGSKKIIVALSMVRGIGYNIAQVMLQSLNINPYLRVGFLTENELKEIELTIKDPSRVGIPPWYLNRRKDMDTGADKHLITSDLDFTISNDIEREKSVMSWRGYRHMFGLKVRGQHTRTSGRKGGAVGVKKITKPGGAAPSAPASTTAAASTTPSKPATEEAAGEASK